MEQGQVVWATSDWHLGHDSIKRFEPSRGEDHEERLIRNYHKVVRPQDRVWFLGDIVLRNRSRLDVFKSLPGTKYLVLGNHDTYPLWAYYEAGFQAVVPLFAWHIRRDGTRVLLSHFPALRTARDNRYLAERNQLKALCKGGINYHGHTHSWTHPEIRFVNTCPEVNDYTPVLLE